MSRSSGSTMGHLGLTYAKLARFSAIFVIMSSYLHQVLKKASLYEVRRVNSFTSPNGARGSLARRHRHKRVAGLRINVTPLSHNGDSYNNNNNNNNIINQDTRGETILERRSNLPNSDRLVGLVYRVLLWFNFFVSIKYIVLCLLDMGTLPFDRFGYLDCLLAGRTTINPRVVSLCKFGSMCVFCFHYIHHWALLRKHGDHLSRDFRLHCLEFLVTSPRVISAYENSNDTHVYCSLLSCRRLAASCKEAGASLKSRRQFVLRPNRSLASWRRLSRVVTLWVGQVICTYVILIPGIWYCVLPMMISRPGFEMTHELCVKWIAAGGSERRANWRWVHEVPEGYAGVAAHWRQRLRLPYSAPRVELSAYHVARVAWQVVENSVGQVQVCMGVVVFTLSAVIISLDTGLYGRLIDARLKEIIADQRRQEPAAVASEEKEAQEQRRQRERNEDAQALVLDLFALVRDYNPYTVHYVCFTISVWYTYSFVCCSWLFVTRVPEADTARDGSAQLAQGLESTTVESGVIQLAATLIILVIMGTYASARLACAQLYKSISVLASIQSLDAATRRRWLVILEHFKPVPLHCFSLFRTSELSWMFALKLTAWLFSALFIVASFSTGLSR